jgi:hypothetical protein
MMVDVNMPTLEEFKQWARAELAAMAAARHAEFRDSHDGSNADDFELVQLEDDSVRDGPEPENDGEWAASAPGPPSHAERLQELDQELMDAMDDHERHDIKQDRLTVARVKEVKRPSLGQVPYEFGGPVNRVTWTR